MASEALAALHRADTETAVAAALALLPPQCRVVFELSRYEELSYQQIAETLEISPKPCPRPLPLPAPTGRT